MTKRCLYCGSKSFEARRIPYLYQRQGRYLLVPNMPVEVCTRCAMEYFAGPDLEAVERQFCAIERHEEQPDKVVQVPVKQYAPRG